MTTTTSDLYGVFDESDRLVGFAGRSGQVISASFPVVVQVKSFKDIASMSWAGQGAPDAIRTWQYSPAGPGLGGAVYVPAGAGPANRYTTQDADGNWWRLELGDVVTPDMFGALGNGVADDSAPFQDAVNIAKLVQLRHDANYVIGDVKPANGVCIVGASVLEYVNQATYNKPRITRKAGCVSVFNLGGTRDIGFRSLSIDGVDRSCNGLSGGGTRIVLERVHVINCDRGLGGTGAGSTDYYSHVVQATACVFGSNNIGVDSLIDSYFTQVEIAGNGKNLRGLTGANSNVFAACRIEWALTDHNVELYQCSDYQFVGGLIDRGAWASIKLIGASHVTLAGVEMRRGAAANDAADPVKASNIYMDGCTDILLVGVNNLIGGDDGGGGNITPRFYVTFNNVNTNVTITGGSYVGATVGAILYNSGRNNTKVPGLKIKGAAGIEDYDTTSALKYDGAGRQFQARGSTSGNLAPGAYVDQVMTTAAINTYAQVPLDLVAIVRDTTYPQSFRANFPLTLWREAGGAAVSSGAACGEVGTAGAIQMGANGSWLRLDVIAVAADGSSITVRITNTNATKAVNAWLELS